MVDQVVHGLAKKFVARVAQQFADLRVDEGRFAEAIEAVDALTRRIQDKAGRLLALLEFFLGNSAQGQDPADPQDDDHGDADEQDNSGSAQVKRQGSLPFQVAISDFEKRLLLCFHCGNESADPIHGQLSPIGADDVESRAGLVGLA